MEECILFNVKVNFEVRFEEDVNVLFRLNVVVVGRYIVIKFCLWVLFIKLNDFGEKIYIERFFKLYIWFYLKEWIVDLGLF